MLKALDKNLRQISLGLLIIVGLFGIVRGLIFIIDPWGRKTGLSTDMLRHSSFSNFFIPGVMLLFFVGVTSALTALTVIRKIRHFRTFIFLQGIILFAWLVAQKMMFHMFHPLQLLIGLAGILLVVIAIRLK